MVDPADAIGKARQAVTERAELPGMSLMEHLDELRKRIVHSAIYLAVGFFVAYVFHEQLYGFVQAPLDKLAHQAQLHPPHGSAEPVPAGGADRRSDSGLALHPLPGVAVHCAGALPERAALRDSLHGGHGGPVPDRRQPSATSLCCPAR